MPSRKSNADTLSRKAKIELRVMFVRLNLYGDGGILVKLQVKLTLGEEIKRKQPLGIEFLSHIRRVEDGLTEDLSINEKRAFCFRKRLCVANDLELKKKDT